MLLSSVNAQHYKLPKLAELAKAGKYEKLVKKADKACQHDDYKKYGEPYFWKAKALLEVDKEFGFLEKYKKAYKDALKAMAKGQKKDELGKDIEKFPNLLKDLKARGHEKAGKFFEDEKYTKANAIYEKLGGLSDDTLSYYMHAQGLLELGNKQESYALLQQVVDLNWADFADSSTSNPNTYQSRAFLKLGQHLMEESIVDSAYEVIFHGSQLFPKDDSIKEAYLQVLKNYQQYYYHYNQVTKALKIVVKAANDYSYDERFIALEQEVLVDFADELIMKGKYPFMQSIFQKYIQRPRDPDVEANLYEANEILVRMMADRYHKSEVVVAQNILTVMKDVNENIRTTVIDSMASFSYEKMITETVSNLNGNDEFYLSNIFLKFARLSLPKNENIKNMEKDNKALHSGLNKHLKEMKKKVLANQSPNAADYIKSLDLARKCNDFDMYTMIDSALKHFPEDDAIKAVCKAFILNDYAINYKGSKLVKELVDNTIIDELNWKGNISKCIPGTISNSASAKTAQRINYFRRMARLNTEMKFDEKMNKKAQRFAFELHPEFEPSKSCKQSKVDYFDFVMTADKYGPFGVSALMEANGDSNYTVMTRKIVLNEDVQPMGHGSTNKNIVLYKRILKDEQEKPETHPGTAWPPNGMIPAKLVPKRWSISHPNADFSKAKVKVKLFGRETPVVVERQSPEAEGMPTLVWQPEDIILYAKIDLSYEVLVYNVYLNGSDQGSSFTYNVTIIQE